MSDDTKKPLNEADLKEVAAGGIGKLTGELAETDLKEVAGGGVGRIDVATPEDKGRKEISDFSF
jgi:hypothetical protein